MVNRALRVCAVLAALLSPAWAQDISVLPPLPAGVRPAAGQGAAELANSASRPVTAPGAPAASMASSSVAADGGITLNFVNADVRDVAKAVLGDFLNLNYTIGANVQGGVTMQTSRPLSRTEVLPALEQSLQLNGLALVRKGQAYTIVPLADAARQSGAILTSRRADAAPGFGIEIVPLRYIGAAQMQHLLEPLAPAQAIVHVDAERNFLLIEGTEQERAAMVDEIGLFDVNWLSGMSFTMFTPKYVDAKGLAKELGDVLGGEHSPLADIVRLVPIERLNSVLAISPQQQYLDQLKGWVDRLDKPGEGAGRRIYVYAVQNGQAADLAKVLRQVLSGNADSSGDTVKQPDEESSFTDQMQSGGFETTGNGGTLGATPRPAVPKRAEDAAVANAGSGTDAATVTADPTNNALIIYGTPQQYGVIASALRQMDVMPNQVLLEAAIAEVTLTDGLQYGVQYFYKPSANNQLALSNTGTTNIATALQGIANVTPGFSYMFGFGGNSNIQIALNALANVTHVQVISSPQVLVLNNHTARLQVGDQVPISTGQAVSTIAGNAPIVNSIEYHATGVILKVTPSINTAGMVTMDISQEVSDVAADTAATALDSPTFEQRKIESTITVHDNETIALGGLISDSKTRSSNGLPFLSGIPVLGALFGTKNNSSTRTELMVLITPHVVDDLGAARAVTDELRREFPAVEALFHKAQ